MWKERIFCKLCKGNLWVFLFTIIHWTTQLTKGSEESKKVIYDFINIYEIPIPVFLITKTGFHKFVEYKTQNKDVIPDLFFHYQTFSIVAFYSVTPKTYSIIKCFPIWLIYDLGMSLNLVQRDTAKDITNSLYLRLDFWFIVWTWHG